MFHMKIDNDKIFRDITTNSEIASIFKLEFPSTTAHIDRLVENNSCFACKNRLFDVLTKSKDMEARLKLIYGDDAIIDVKNLPTPTNPNMHANYKRFLQNNSTKYKQTFVIPADQWEEWFNSFTEKEIEVTTSFCFYNPSTNEITVSIDGLEPKK